MKDSYLLPLLTLAKKGKVKGSVYISSKDLGKELGVSQQTASRWLKELESSGADRKNICERRADDYAY